MVKETAGKRRNLGHDFSFAFNFSRAYRHNVQLDVSSPWNYMEFYKKIPFGPSEHF